MKICELHHTERPRERLAARGPGALSEEELLAAVLRTGYAGRSALELAGEILRDNPDGKLGRLPFPELSRLKGVGPSRAASLAAALELSRRWSEGGKAPEALDTPSKVWERLQDLRSKRKEHFVALYLNARNQLVHRETVSIGTLTASLVHPREVFGPAVEHRAAHVVVAHNHPSGDPSPSPEDKETTRRLVQAGRILGIPVVDHLVVGHERYFSFREHGLL